jgi:hypothetical protein
VKATSDPYTIDAKPHGLPTSLAGRHCQGHEQNSRSIPLPAINPNA